MRSCSFVNNLFDSIYSLILFFYCVLDFNLILEYNYKEAVLIIKNKNNRYLI